MSPQPGSSSPASSAGPTTAGRAAPEQAAPQQAKAWDPARDQEWDAVVVGGGIAGLSAAWELARTGLRPLVVEARGYIGGLVASAPVAGVQMDLGADAFAARGSSQAGSSADADLGPAGLMAALNLSTAPAQGRASLFVPLPPDAPQHPGNTGDTDNSADSGDTADSTTWGMRPFPADSFLGLPANPQAPDVVAIIGAAAAQAAAQDRDLPGSVGTGPEDPGDLAAFISARMGAGVLERLVRPVIAGIHSADPSALAADSVLPGLRAATARLGSLGAAVAELLEQRRRRSGPQSGGGDFGVEGGLFRAAQALQREIEQAGGSVLTRTGAQWLTQEAPGRWRVGIAPTRRGATPSAEPVAAGEAWQVRTARVVLACSATPALRLLTGVPGVDTQVEIPAGAPVARLFMVVRASELDAAPVGSGLLVAPSSEADDGDTPATAPGSAGSAPPPCPVGAKALSHLSVKWPWIGQALTERHGPSVHALRLSYGRPGQPRPEVDLKQALRDIATLTGAHIEPDAVIDHRLVRWDETLAPMTPAHRERVQRLTQQVDAAGGLALTGAWVAGSGVAGVVTHARTAARGLVKTLRLGTRGSRLALTQSTQVAHALQAAGGPNIEMATVRTQGDGDRTPLSQLGGIGVFAAQLRLALLHGEVDLAVHSCKDLPSADVAGLELICVPAREDPRDALCARDGLTLATLPRGARVGTGSPRRVAQLLALRPDLEVVDLRGNVPTRLSRVRGLAQALGVGRDEPVAPVVADAQGDLDAVVLAAAGLARLGLGHCVTELLDPTDMLPAPAQGALALEARAGALANSPELQRAVAALEHLPTRLAVTAERALMATLGAGCAAPLGAWAQVVSAGGLPLAPWEAGPGEAALPQAGCFLELRAVVLSPDSAQRVTCREQVALPQDRDLSRDLDRDQGLEAAQELGQRAAEALVAGGAEQITDLRAARPGRR